MPLRCPRNADVQKLLCLGGLSLVLGARGRDGPAIPGPGHSLGPLGWIFSGGLRSFYGVVGAWSQNKEPRNPLSNNSYLTTLIKKVANQRFFEQPSATEGPQQPFEAPRQQALAVEPVSDSVYALPNTPRLTPAFTVPRRSQAYSFDRTSRNYVFSAQSRAIRLGPLLG